MVAVTLEQANEENKRLRAAIAAWAAATYPPTRPDPRDIEGRCKAQAALEAAESALYDILKEER